MIDHVSLRRRRRFPPTHSSVVDMLRADIIEGTRTPGTQLKQDELSSCFGVSQGPVREALRRLESEGLVEHRPNRGAFVTLVTTEELLDVLLPVRLVIEQHAARGIDQRPETLSDLAELVSAMHEAAEHDDRDSMNALDVEFHARTVHSCGSMHAMQIWHSVEPRIRLQIHRLSAYHGSLAEITAEHVSLLAAFTASSPAAVQGALQDHIIGSAQQLLETERRTLSDTSS